MATKVTMPDASSTAGQADRRGAITNASSSPAVPASITGTLTIDARKPGIAPGTSLSVFARPRSSALSLV